jgi:SpoVK/Ycf46/Vps4 family AAA+-type ATPase
MWRLSSKDLTRVLQRDADWPGLVPYQEFLMDVAKACEGFSGAALAGVARAAASHALERAVTEFSRHILSADGSTASAGDLVDCLVTRADFNEAVADVIDSMGSSDHSDDDENVASDTKNGVESKVDNAESDVP